MTGRLVALALLLAALAVWLGPTRALRDEAARLTDEHRRLRDERRDVQRRLVRGVPRRAAGPATVTSARRAMIVALDGSGLAGVRLSVQPARGAGPVVRVSGEGRYAEVMAAVARIADPAEGLVLRRVSLTPRAGGRVALELEAAGAGPS